jgi:hypothetical protein
MRFLSTFRSTIFGVLILATAAALAAQSRAGQTPATGPLAPFGVTEAVVRAQILDAVESGLIPGSKIVATIQTGYERVPAAMRGPATTAALAWAKTVVSSSAFTSAYAKLREERRPRGVAAAGSIDEQVSKEIDEQIAMYEQSRKNMSEVPLSPAERAAVMKGIDDALARVRSPEYRKGLRTGLEATTAGKAEDAAKAAADFAANWPADPNVFVRKKLEYIMTATADLDYSLPTFWVKNPAGRTVGFLSPGLESLPWEAARAIVVGKESVDAARAAIAVWLRELSK